MLESCSIVFDKRGSGVFYSGERISGYFNLHLDEAITMTDLELKSRGICNCLWSERYDKVTITYSSFLELYKSTMSLLMNHPRDNVKNTVTLAAGSHSFPFSVTIPDDAPTSFETHTGKVRFYINVKAVRHGKRDEKFKLPFTVISKVDLNAVPGCDLPSNADSKRRFGSFVSQGALKMAVDIPMSGFLPGQQIPVTCSIYNYSKVPVQEVIFTVVRVVTYNATTPWKHSKVIKNSVVKYVGRGVDKLEEIFYQTSFPIPSTPPTTLDKELPVVVEYLLKVTGKVSKMHSNPQLVIPLIVGNIPFTDTQKYYGIDQSKGSSHINGPSTSSSLTTDFPPPYLDLVPPSYQACCDGEPEDGEKEKVEIKTDDGIEFCPQYPVFHFPETNLQTSPVNLKS